MYEKPERMKVFLYQKRIAEQSKAEQSGAEVSDLISVGQTWVIYTLRYCNYKFACSRRLDLGHP
jgi:hypothetical protein